MYNSLKPSNIREENMKQIIRMIRLSSELLSRVDISRRLSLSAPSVSAIINSLLKAGILFESEEGVSGKAGGRKPILLELNRKCGFIIGAHIENSRLIVVLANVCGEIIDKLIFDYQVSEKFDVLTFLTEKIENILEKNDVLKEKLLSIGITVPGIYDTNEKIIKFAPNISIWQNIPIKEDLENYFDCEVVVENAVNSAVLGERWQGKIAGKDNAVYVKIDKGIGAGLLINGNLYRGFSNLAGEIGFMVTDENSIPSRKGNFGALEQTCSILSIEKQASQILGVDQVFFKDLIAMIDDNEQIKVLIKEACFKIAMVLANIICVINPQIVVIGGSFAAGLSKFLPEMVQTINRIVPLTPEIVLSELGDKVYYLGAIVQALEGIEGNLVKRYFN